MAPGAANQQPQSSQLPPVPSSSSAATTEEEEFFKRNTDCVYFLASPLTCKKGSECEYRHSDIARVNPRDCWYWLNGNCLNPKCGFRHPPLDGLLGAEAATPMGSSVPQAPLMPAPNAMSKQGVACIFFQKGFCLKGHLCPFLHGPPNVVNNKAMQQPMPPNPVSKPSKTASIGPEKSIQDQKFTQQESVQKPTEFLPQGKQVPKVQVHAPSRNGGGIMEKKAVPPLEEAPMYRPASVVPPTAMNEFPASRCNHDYEALQVSDNEGNLTGKEVDEYSREPTPGFDVLVDGESEYYRDEEQFGRSRGHDFDMGRSTDFDVDRDMYNEQLDYDRYNGEGYAWEDRRESSERMLGGGVDFGRKRYPRDDSPDRFDKLDLRHQISKQRRGGDGGGLRSVVSRDRHPDWMMPRRDRHDHHLDPGSLSSRLRGRIKIPERSGNGNDLRAERGRSRYSPASSNHSRLRDRIKGRTIEDFNVNGRGTYRGSSRGQSDNDIEFTGPKRLSELKSGRVGEGYKQKTDDCQSLGKRKYPKAESQRSEDKLSFEGPKPLSEILKRKRGGSVLSSVIEADGKSKESNGKEMEESEKQTTENNKVGSIDEDAMLDQELEGYEHRDGDYDYEQIDGEDYNLEEGENLDEEYYEEMEGDEETGKKESEIKVYS